MKIVEFSSSDEQLLEQVRQLRAYVWTSQMENMFLEPFWTDFHDTHACLWAVFDDTEKEIIASARLCFHKESSEFPDYGDVVNLSFLKPPIGMMTRLVVHPAYQKKGIAKKLDALRITKSIDAGCRSMMAAIPKYRKKSLHALGFKEYGKFENKNGASWNGFDFFLYIKFL